MPFPGQRPGSRSATCPGRNEKNEGKTGRVPAFFFCTAHQAEERGKARKGPLPGLYRRCGTLAGRKAAWNRYIRNDLFFISDTLRKYYEAQPTGLSSETELRPVSSVLICHYCPLKGVPASVYNVNVWVTASSLLFAGYVNILEEVNDVTTEPSSKEGSMIDIMLISLLQNR